MISSAGLLSVARSADSMRRDNTRLPAPPGSCDGGAKPQMQISLHFFASLQHLPGQRYATLRVVGSCRRQKTVRAAPFFTVIVYLSVSAQLPPHTYRGPATKGYTEGIGVGL